MPTYDVCVQIFQGFKFLLGDDPKPSWEPNVRVMNIVKPQNQDVLFAQDFRVVVLGGVMV